MGGAAPAPTGKRSLDATINLVPFIDLLSVCICFLLISAVWTQVAKIDVKPAPNSPSDEPPPPEDEEKVKLTVHIQGSGYVVSDGGSQQELKKVEDKYPVEDLEKSLKAMREAYPENTAVTVMPDDTVPYNELIKVMDKCLKYELADISVSAAM